MIIDWRPAIVEMVRIKDELREVDLDGLYSQYLPSVAAKEEELLHVEKVLGFGLDEHYRNFLLNANGWRGFIHSADLFGTAELLDTSKDSLRTYANEILNVIDDVGVLRDSGFKIDDLLPICTTRWDRDVFVIAKPNSPSPGSVIWFAGYEIERYQDFDECFMSMIEYNKLVVQSFIKDNSN